MRIAPEARAALMALLGGDRQASRNEVASSRSMPTASGEVTLEDVMAIVTDASELALDADRRYRLCRQAGRRSKSRSPKRWAPAPIPA